MLPFLFCLPSPFQLNLFLQPRSNGLQPNSKRNLLKYMALMWQGGKSSIPESEIIWPYWTHNCREVSRLVIPRLYKCKSRHMIFAWFLATIKENPTDSSFCRSGAKLLARSLNLNSISIQEFRRRHLQQHQRERVHPAKHIWQQVGTSIGTIKEWMLMYYQASLKEWRLLQNHHHHHHNNNSYSYSDSYYYYYYFSYSYSYYYYSYCYCYCYSYYYYYYHYYCYHHDYYHHRHPFLPHVTRRLQECWSFDGLQVAAEALELQVVEAGVGVIAVRDFVLWHFCDVFHFQLCASIC